MKQVLSEQEKNDLFNLIKVEYSQNGRSALFQRCERVIVNTLDWPFILRFCEREGVDLKKISEYIIQTQDVNVNKQFAKKFNIDPIGHGQVIIAFGSEMDNLDYMKSVKGSDIKTHDEIIIESKNVFANMESARIFKINKDRHAQVVATYGSADDNVKFVQDVFDADVRLHGKRIAEVGTGMQNYYYIMNNPTADKNLHLQAILNGGEPDANYFAGRFVDDADRRKHGEVVIKSGHVEWNMQYMSLDGADKQAHANVILEKGTLDQILDASLKIASIDLKPISDIILEQGSPAQSYQFISSQLEKARVNKGNPTFSLDFIKKHGQKVINSGSFAENIKFAQLQGADLEAHQQMFIDSQNASQCVKFAKLVNGANKELLGSVVLDYGTVDDAMDYYDIAQMSDMDIKPYAYKIIHEGEALHNLKIIEKDAPYFEEHLYAIIVKMGGVSEMLQFINDSYSLSSDMKSKIIERIMQSDETLSARAESAKQEANKALEELLDKIDLGA